MPQCQYRSINPTGIKRHYNEEHNWKVKERGRMPWQAATLQTLFAERKHIKYFALVPQNQLVHGVEGSQRYLFSRRVQLAFLIDDRLWPMRRPRPGRASNKPLKMHRHRHEAPCLIPDQSQFCRAEKAGDLYYTERDAVDKLQTWMTKTVAPRYSHPSAGKKAVKLIVKLVKPKALIQLR